MKRSSEEIHADQVPVGGRPDRPGARAPMRPVYVAALALFGLGTVGGNCKGTSGGGGTGGGACAAGTTSCPGSCANLGTDPLNCGTCGVICASVKVGSTCQSGSCTCPSGQSPCALSANGLPPTCVADSNAHCGNACAVCPGGTVCENGSCRSGVLGLVPTKTTYAAGEQIVINVKLTNVTATPCEVILSPRGSITISSLTVNGTPVVPDTTVASYANGMTDALLQHLDTIPANGGSKLFPWVSDVFAASQTRYTLQTQTMDDSSGANVATWSVKQPGQYQMTVQYAPPPLKYGAPADLCRFADTATVAFTVN